MELLDMIDPVACSAVIMLVFLFLKIPVFISVLSGGVCYFLLMPHMPGQIFAQRVISGTESIPLLAIPFFVCAGVFMNYTGVTKRIMDFCSVLLGTFTGGLAQVAILLSTLMGGLSGSNLADAAMEAKMLVPSMVERGFSKPFASVVTATSAIITPLIPPGIAMIIYGSVANLSIGKLFIGGIGPGVMLCVLMMLMVSVISHKRGYKPMRTERATFGEFCTALKAAFLPLCLPFLIIGGIRVGLFTPTEAGAVAIVYSLFLGAVYHEMRLRDILTGIYETVTTSASIMIIIGAASTFAWILTKERIPQELAQMMITFLQSPFLFLLIVNLFLLVVGMFLEGNAAMIILVPLLAPIAAHFGIDAYQFAIVVIFNLAIGALSPPMGTLMFVTCGVTKCRMSDFIREAVPFYILLLFCLFLLTAFPVFSSGFISLFY
ncbi:TRAP transporter large permease [Selenomonas montiformis]|uniref:TRAP transporter large permease n=1 Tax=Selenomonas montiformis TaxID=2652285 RepID=UPI003F8B4D60